MSGNEKRRDRKSEEKKRKKEASVHPSVGPSFTRSLSPRKLHRYPAHARVCVRALTRSPGSEAVKSRGTWTNPECNTYTHTQTYTYTHVCVESALCSAASSGADVSINSGTRRPSQLISIHSRHTYSMCHEIIGRLLRLLPRAPFAP